MILPIQYVRSGRAITNTKWISTTCAQNFNLVPKAFTERKKPVVSVIKLHGLIAPKSGRSFGQNRLNIETLKPIIDKAFAPKRLKAIFLSINSPGGQPVQCELISNYIGDKVREKRVPIYSFVEDVAASGGYWLACCGDTIYVSRASVVGSIGVISGSFGFQELIEKLGIERRLFTAGNKKSYLDPFKPMQEQDVERNQRILDEIHTVFKDWVKTRRGEKIGNAMESDIFSGEFWIGGNAVELGLADGIDSVHSFARREYGDSVRLIEVKKKSNPFEHLVGALTPVIRPQINATEIVEALQKSVKEENKFELR